MSAAQARALADHHISWDEYDAGFQAYRTCLHERGIELVDPHVEGDLWDFRIPGATDPDGVDAHCYQYHWEKVDDEWQLAHVDTSPSAEFLRQCLESFDVRPVEKYQDNLKLLRRAGKTIMDCPDGS